MVRVIFKNFLRPTYVDNQLLFWKYSAIFLFLIWPQLGPLLTFFGPLVLFLVPFGLFLGSGSDSKTFLDATIVDNQFLFWKFSPILMF